MESKVTTWLVAGVVVAGLLVLGGFVYWKNVQPGQYDAFAKCLGEKGVKFYGAFWCPHCQNQKSLFGNSAKYLPYIECSTPDGQGKLPVCETEKIGGYPTWKFADGTVQEGEMSLQALSDRSSCPLK